MKPLLRLSVLLVFGLLASQLSAANIDSYYYWNLTTGDGWIDDGALWTSEDGLNTGYVPGTTPNAGTDVYRQWAVIANTGLAKIDENHVPWGASTNYPQNIWVGNGSTTKAGPFGPSEGHVLQTGGDVGYISYLFVGRDNAPGTSTYDLQGGSLNQIYTGTGYVIVGHTNATGVMTVSNDAKIIAPTGVVRVGDQAGSNGTLSMSGTSRLTANYLTVASYGAQGQVSVGKVNLSGDAVVTLGLDASFGSYYYTDGTINLSGNATLTAARRINVGDNSSWTYRDAIASGYMNITENATVSTDQIRIGKYQYGVGTTTVASTTGTATLNVTGNMTVGNDGGRGYLIVGDGGVVNHTGDWVAIGSLPRTDPLGLETFISTGTVTMNGGVFNHTDASTGIALGIQGQTGTWTQNGGALVSAGPIRFGHGGGTALLNLNGGVVQVPSIAVDAVAAPSMARINFNGGTLRAGAAGGLIVDGTTPVLSLKVQAGGAVIDSNSFDVVIDPALAEDDESTGGGLTKIGAGKLTLGGANSYTGDTLVMEGELAVDGSITSDVTVADGASLMGSGLIAGNVIVGDGAEVGPGSSIGTLTITGDLTVGGTLDIDYDSDADTIDLVSVSGQLDLTGGTLSFGDLGSGTLANGAYVFATYGSLVGAPAIEVGVPDYCSVDYAYGGNSIALVAVPEPATFGLLASLLLAFGLARLRSKSTL
ncbi:MAG TPA: hypothetical protein DD670_02170 [Planctomycetaceae bacterium]|nr:hypothetical protein [Planctomycetaceae bacterium]